MLDYVTQIVVYLVMVSVAAERLTDIFKRVFVETFKIPTFNGALYQAFACIFGALIARISPPDIPVIHLNEYVLVIIIGLAVSGGSGAWNSILDILKQLSASKKIENNIKG